jgi:hypothetical protein
MSNLSPFPERLQRVFRSTDRGVVGLVDDLLVLCREQGLQLDWHTNQCRVRPLGVEAQESTDVPLPKSVFRAVLARVAALCNERMPHAVSPYGGQGELTVGAHPDMVLRATFINTTSEQRLELTPVQREAVGEVPVNHVAQPAPPPAEDMESVPRKMDP